MGCDIHLYAEQRMSDGTWEEILGPIQTCWACDGSGMNRLGACCEICNKDPDSIAMLEEQEMQYFLDVCVGVPGKMRGAWYDGRSYSLFAVLAGVRNYSDVTPISPPKGLPDDCSASVRKRSDSWAEVGHSHSWLTIEEIMGVVGGEVPESGVLDPITYLKLTRLKQEPSLWCGLTSMRTVTSTEFEREFSALPHDVRHALIDGLSIKESDPDPKTHGLPHVHAEWSSNSVMDFFLKRIAPLIELGKSIGESNVRVVFWFDN